MKLDKISLEFSAEELEALQYTLELGIRSWKKKPLKQSKDWIEKSERIRQILPTKMRMMNDSWDKAGNFFK